MLELLERFNQSRFKDAAFRATGAMEDRLQALGIQKPELRVLFDGPDPRGLNEMIAVWEARRRHAGLKAQTLDDWQVEAALTAALNHWLNDESLNTELVRLLGDRRAGLRKTRFLYAGFLTGAVYEVGRRLSKSDPQRSAFYLDETVIAGRLALGLMWGAEEAQARYLHGFIGVVSLLLAFTRRDKDNVRELRQAAFHLSESGSRGDSSVEHARYLGEALLELGDVTRDLVTLHRAEQHLRDALRRYRGDAELSVLLARALFQESAGAHKEFGAVAGDRIVEAIGLYTVGLDSRTGYRRSNLLGRRGQARLVLAWGKEEDAGLAIDDLRAAVDAGEPQWLPSLIDALLTRQSKRDEPSDAAEAWELSKRPCPIGLSARRAKAAYMLGRLTDNATVLRDVLDCSDADASVLARATALIGLLEDDAEILERAIGLLTPLEQKGGGPGLLPKVANRLARLIGPVEPVKALDLLRLAAERLIEGTAGATNAWLAARNAFQQWKIGRDSTMLDHAVDLVSQAKDFGETPENLVFASDVYLQSAKQESDPARRDALLEASLADLATAVPLVEGLDPAVTASKQGEIALRLGTLRGDELLLTQARRWFLQSARLGNKAPALAGLLGDTLYQLAKDAAGRRQVKLFRSALWWKRRSRRLMKDVGRESAREHHSLCARIAERLAEAVTDKSAYVIQIAEHLRQARLSDPAWPWPICQIAELVSSGLLRQFDDPDAEIGQAVERGDHDAIWLAAAKLAAVSNEFNTDILGGKSGVWYLQDGHGLVSSTFVFKPAAPRNLKRFGVTRVRQQLQAEMERTRALGEYLRLHSSLPVSVPTVLGVIDGRDGSPVLAMRRLTGVTLADLIMKDSAKARAHVATAVEVLAIYQGRTPLPEARMSARLEELLSRADRRRWNVEPVVARLPGVMTMPLVARRDAHPGNWFVTRSRQLVVLDVEHPTPKLFLEELVQLVDDLPLLAWDHAGIEQRKDWIRQYANQWEVSSGRHFETRELDLWSAYLVFAFLLSIFGLTLTEASASRESLSFSSRRMWSRRRQHYEDLAAHSLNELALLEARGIQETN